MHTHTHTSPRHHQIPSTDTTGPATASHPWTLVQWCSPCTTARRVTETTMASLVTQPRHSIQTYWSRRSGYHRLSSSSPSRRLRIARLGGIVSRTAAATALTSSSLWKARRLALARRAAALLAAPALLLVRLRDAYVDAMVKMGGSAAAVLARSRSGAAEPAALWDRRVPRARLSGSASKSKSKSKRGGGEFERRMMAHIYSMVVTPELPCAARA